VFSDIVRILTLIMETPNLRTSPRVGDLKGHFTSWFDGGAVFEPTGLTSYRFDDGSAAMVHILGYLYITITLADGQKVILIEQNKRSGKELILTGMNLVEPESQPGYEDTLKPIEFHDEASLNPPPEPEPLRYPQVFSFCTRCGHVVEPYLANGSSSEIHQLTDSEPRDPPVDSHYWCTNCDHSWLGFDSRDTGVFCSVCNTLKPYVADYCGKCGTARNRVKNM
jgi:hypothetical protein